MRFTGSRMVFALTAALAIAGPAAPKVKADAIYSVTNLGTADPSGNYLNALSPADQAAFQTGSFDQYAHPAVGNPLTGLLTGEGDVPYTFGTHDGVIFAGRYFTSNNNGIDVGTGTFDYGTGTTPGSVTAFAPSPHVGNVPSWGGIPGYSVQSPGYVSVLDEGALNATPTGINDHNVVIANVGGPRATIFLPPTDPAAANSLFLTGNHPEDLGTLGGPTPNNQPFRTSYAAALNDAGQIVGWSQTPGGAQHAFLDSASTYIMQDLNTLIPPTSGLTLTDAVGIDASGRIVAYGTDASGATHEVLLTPVPQAAPEPTTIVLFGLAAVAFGARRLMIGRRKSPRSLDA